MTDGGDSYRKAFGEIFFNAEMTQWQEECSEQLSEYRSQTPVKRVVVSPDFKSRLQSMARLYELYEIDGGFNKTLESKALFDVCFPFALPGGESYSSELERGAQEWPEGTEYMYTAFALFAKLAVVLNDATVTQDKLAVETLGTFMGAALGTEHIRRSPALAAMLETFVNGLSGLGEFTRSTEAAPQVAKVFAFPARSQIGKDINPPGTRLPAHHAQARRMFDEWATDPAKHRNKAQFATAVVRERLCDDPQTAGKWLKEFLKELPLDSPLSIKLAKK